MTGQDLLGRTLRARSPMPSPQPCKVDAVVFIGGLNKGDHQDFEGADRCNSGCLTDGMP